MPDINKDLLLYRILHSGDFTALEKRYLEELVTTDSSCKDYSKYLRRLTELEDSADPEEDHIEADNILCELLRSVGFEKMADAFEKVEKWYS